MITPWMALVLIDAVTVATFARCFSGPGELAIAIPVCIGAHVLAHLARRVSREGRRVGGWGFWLLAAVLVALVPVAIVDGASFHWALPLGATQHLVGRQLQAAWTIFSYRVAPVREAAGLVLATAWAAGALALAAEALDADTTLPAIVALVPAFDIVVFTGTLGTPTGRAPELAALAALAVWYLAGVPRVASGEQVVTARVEGTRGQLDEAGLVGSRVRRSGSMRVFSRVPSTVPALVIVAAVAGGVVGPLLPGATSLPLVAWRSSGHGSSQNVGGPSGGSTGPVTVNNLVQVGEEEINNADVALLTVYGGSTLTREVLAVLDNFNGDQWTRSSGGHLARVRQFSGEMISLEAHLPGPIKFTNRELITQVISDIDLAGDELPAPGPVRSIDGPNNATIQGSDGPVTIPGSMSEEFAYGLQAWWMPSPAVAQEFLNPSAAPAPAMDLQLPTPIPAAIVDLAQTLVTPGMSEVDKAESIQDFLLSPPFHYVLPTTVPVDQTGSYVALSSFLFSSHAGYCQQFASAFAVLARIDGLATRVAVGFLPSAPSHGAWLVTGKDVHAWPQVYFPGTGWIDFEPTPGSGSPPYPAITVPTTVPTTTSPVGGRSTRVTLPPAHNFQPAPGGTTGSTFTIPKTPSSPSPARRAQPPGSGDVVDVLIALLVGAMLWALVVPTWRFVRQRRSREPLRTVLLAWQEATTVLAAAGLHRRRAETFQEFALRVRKSGALSDEAAESFDRLAGSANRALFALRPPTEEEAQLARLDSKVARCSGRRAMAWWAQVLIQLDPRDLLANA